MARFDDPFGLLNFAANYLRSRSITCHSEIVDEDLADCFRESFGLPPFPSYADLLSLCVRTGVRVDDLPAALPELPGAYGWDDEGAPTIFLNPEIQRKKAEHTVGHEIREILESSFIRVRAAYRGLETHDNRRMNPHSDRFGAALLMPTAETKQALAENGYDLLKFAESKHRPLASVILRAQRLFPSRDPFGPLAGSWLFEAPWSLMRGRPWPRPEDLRLVARAAMNGFSMAKGKAGASDRHRELFPMPGSTARSYHFAWIALERRRPNFDVTMSSHSITERDFAMVAEPVYVNHRPWRVLVTAVKEGPERSMAKPLFDRVFPPL